MRERKRTPADAGWAAIGIAMALYAFALFPSQALGATARIEIKRVWFTADVSEVNDLTISLSGGNYELKDSEASIAAGPGCSGSGHTVLCPASGIIGLTVSAGDEDDSIKNATAAPSTISGGEGNDSLEGGSGNDVIRGNKGLDTQTGGAGDDFIDSRGDKADIVTCGIGNDAVSADGADTVAGDCEIVDRGGAPPPPPPGPASGPSPAAAGLLGPGETSRLAPGACAKETIGTPADDLLNGTTIGDSLFGLQGNDVLAGLPGDDCLFGGIGSDRLSGAEGDDRVLGDDGKNGVGGDDSLSGNDGNDLLSGGPGNDRLYGGRGADRLSGGRGKDRLSAGEGRNVLRGGYGKDRLRSVNGRVDWVNCGPARDSARVDAVDRVRGCERVHRVH
jgi:Ca2+-binding RTX toxin-like protein